MRNRTRDAALHLAALALVLIVPTRAAAQVPDNLPTPDPGRWGTLKGRVVYGGDPPGAKILVDPADPNLKDRPIIARRGPIRSERLVVDPATRGVRDAFVFLAQPSVVAQRARGASPTSVKFRADRGVLVPHALALMEGTEVVIETDDPILYQVRGSIIGGSVFGSGDSMLRKPGELVRTLEGDFFSNTGEFNVAFGSAKGRATARIRPRAGRAEPITVVSDIHNWMSARWLVLDHPYFAVTDERGEFTIEDVPAGSERVIVWHEAAAKRGRSVVFDAKVAIKSGEVTTLNLTLDPVAFPPE